MIAIEQAVRLIARAAEPLGTEEVSLEKAAGRVLAEAVVADRDFPPTDRSAMDGFAVRSADFEGRGSHLSVVGEVPAGDSAEGIEVGPGQAVRIFTGSVIPPGADAVVMVERTVEDRASGSVEIEISPERGAHIRRRGSEFLRDDVVLEAGSPIHAPEMAALAAVGRTRVEVHRRPAVNVLSTGDELVEPEQAPRDHQVRNSNGVALLAQLDELGLKGRRLGIAFDSRAALERLLRRGLEGDVLLVTGGVSVGSYDIVAEVLTDAGMELLFHKVAVKPGKPVLAGRCRSCLVIGLPGNPLSAYTGFAVFVAPALRRLMGYRRWENVTFTASLAEPLRCGQDRVTYRLARLEPGATGFVARVVRSAGSGDVLSMARANGFLVTPAGEHEFEPGAELPAMLWRDFMQR
jgi:molybdopterin molybdotransferase